MAAWYELPARIYIRREPGEPAPRQLVLLHTDDSEPFENDAAACRDMVSGRESVINS